MSSFRTIQIFCSVVVFFCAKLARCEEFEPATGSLAFINATPEMEVEARQIIEKTVNYFEVVTGKSVGQTPIVIRFVSELPDHEEGAFSTKNAMTIWRGKWCTVIVSTKADASPGRLLAHEVTHVFQAEAFGKVENQTLREGLAEYISAQQYPFEVRENLRKASDKGTPTLLAPYVEGYRFCFRHGQHKAFAKFYSEHLRDSGSSFEKLENAWKGAMDGKDSAGASQSTSLSKL